MVLQKQYNSIYSKYFGSKVKRMRAGSATRELHASPCVHAQSLSHIVLFAIPRTVVHQASLSMGFPGMKYWSGSPFPPPEDLFSVGIEAASPAPPALQADYIPLH